MFGYRSPWADACALGHGRLAGAHSLAAGANPSVGIALRLNETRSTSVMCVKRKAQAEASLRHVKLIIVKSL
jgi:hypothetical protein